MDFFLNELNASLYLETKNLCDEINKKANIRISKIPYKLGGGGSSELLYFICRLRKPSTVLETGVATGFSTTSILHAIRKNRMGRLYSSDFPYLKIPNSIKYIGLLVEDIDKKKLEHFTKWR